MIRGAVTSFNRHLPDSPAPVSPSRSVSISTPPSGVSGAIQSQSRRRRRGHDIRPLAGWLRLLAQVSGGGVNRCSSWCQHAARTDLGPDVKVATPSDPVRSSWQFWTSGIPGAQRFLPGSLRIPSAVAIRSSSWAFPLARLLVLGGIWVGLGRPRGRARFERLAMKRGDRAWLGKWVHLLGDPQLEFRSQR